MVFLMVLASTEMFLHEEQDDEPTDTDDKGEDDEEKGEQELMDPEGVLWVVNISVTAQENIDCGCGRIAMVEEMLDRYTGR